MSLGQAVDFCIEYNKINNPDKKSETTVRQATQEDWDRLGI